MPVQTEKLAKATADLESHLRGSSGASRMPHVDGLRAIAMLIVLFGHGWQGFQYHIPVRIFGHQTDLTQFLQVAYLGVPGFLALSGFCLFYPYVACPDRKDPSLLDFWRRRIRRIIPPYYATLAIFGLIALTNLQPGGPMPIAFIKRWFLWHLPLLHNLRPEYAGAVNATMWSMGLEWQLYVFFPILFVLYKRFNPGWVAFVSFLVTLVVREYVRSSCEIMGSGDDINLYVLSYSVFGRIFDFSIGMYIATKLAKRPGHGAFANVSIVERAMFVLAGLASAFLLVRNALQMPGYQDIENFPIEAAWAMFFAGLILWTLKFDILHKIVAHPVLVFLGVISYSVYLLQGSILWPICGALSRHTHGVIVPMLLEYGLVLPLVIGLGYLFHLAYERPYMTKPGTQPVSETSLEAQRNHRALVCLVPLLLAALMAILSRC